MSMIITLLKEDHQKVAGMLEELSHTTTRGVKKRETLFASLQKELGVHEEFEETELYTRLEEYKATKDQTLESFEEHRVMDYLLALMDEIAVDDETWKAKLKVLTENIEHHVEEEEKILFPLSKKVLSSEKLQELGSLYEKFKESHLG